MTRAFEQYVEDLDLTNDTDQEQCLEVRFRFFSDQFTHETILRILEEMDDMTDNGAIDVYLDGESIYNA